MTGTLTSQELDRIGISRARRRDALACCLIRIRRGVYMVGAECADAAHERLRQFRVTAESMGGRASELPVFADETPADRADRLRAVLARDRLIADNAEIDVPGLRGHAARLRILARSMGENLPPDAGLSHVSAALLWGMPLVRKKPSHVEAVRSGAGRVTAKRVIRRRDVGEADFTTLDGVRLTTPMSTLRDVALDHPLDVTVPMLDHSLRDLLVVQSELDAIGGLLRGVRGAKRARAAFALADAARESPAESICAVRFHEHGIDGFEPQVVFRFDEDGSSARVDFFHRGAGVIVEVNGEIKYADGADGAARARQERQREFRLRSLGYHVFQLSWADLFRPHVFQRIRSTVAERSRLHERTS